MWKLICYCCLVLITIENQRLNWAAQAKPVRVVELKDSWTLRNISSTVQINVPEVPSGVYTALKSVYGDLLQDDNDVALRWIANETWIYEKTFDDDEFGYNNNVNITLHGIDTLAQVRLNGELLGETENMFVRYSFVVGHLLRPSNNILQIELLSPLKEAYARAAELASKGISAPPNCPNSGGDVACHRNMLRKMQMSFGGNSNPAALSSGIWKPVVIEYYEVGILRDVDVAINRNATHWTMDCRAFLSTGATTKFYAELMVHASELLDEPFVVPQQELNAVASVLDFQVHIPKERVVLWWPNGYGKQKLYPVLFSMKCYSSIEGSSLSARTNSEKLLKIGFRTIELNEDKDKYGRNFLFRINGQPIFMKGANYMPAHTLPELAANTKTVDHLLKSAKMANMNMLRVWGGGLYESDTFYSLADHYGLLVWQDMAFTLSTYPINDEFVSTVRKETAQNAKRLAYHPSLALIVTNSEIELYLVKNRSEFATEATRLEEEYKLLFMGTLKPELNIISRYDFSPRPGPMISTPSLGIEESGKDLSTNPQNPHYGDVHIWDYENDPFNPDVYPQGRFITEFGFASLPIAASWRRALTKDRDSNAALAKLIQQRQHDPKGFEPMLRLIKSQLPFELDDWQQNIEEFIYFSQVAQAMAAKMAFDLFRSLRIDNQTMGALFWQLNDVWVAPTWSCIDYHGNYKLVYYWAKQFLTPINVMGLYDEANNLLKITLTRESYTEHADSQLYNVVVNTYSWSDLFSKKTIARNNVLDSNDIMQLSIPLGSVLYEDQDKYKTFFEIQMEDKNKQIMAHTYVYPVAIREIVTIMDPQLKLEVIGVDCSAITTTTTFANSFSLRISVKYPALFVYLELNHPDYSEVMFQFSENGFTQTTPVKTVQLLFEYHDTCITLTTQHIKVMTMNKFLL